MSPSIERPKHGLPLDEAFAKWSDPVEYQVLVEIAGTPELPTINKSRMVVQKDRQEEYELKRQDLEDDFRDLLLSGDTILASAIAVGSARRAIIEPSLWEMLEIDFDLHDVAWTAATYEMPEFFGRNAIPSNITRLPDWLYSEPTARPHKNEDIPFEHDPAYQHIRITHKFSLGPICAKVVQLLDEAAKDGDPWVAGKILLQRAGSAQSKVHDVFKSVIGWQILIESDGLGRYRLRPSAER